MRYLVIVWTYGSTVHDWATGRPAALSHSFVIFMRIPPRSLPLLPSYRCAFCISYRPVPLGIMNDIYHALGMVEGERLESGWTLLLRTNS